MNCSEFSDLAIQHFRAEMLDWHRQHGRHFPWRKQSASNYNKIIAEVLLQRTRAETVAQFFPTFLARYRSWSQLATANEDELIALIRPVGLWRRRSRTLINLATEMAKRNGRFPRDRGQIEALPGVGQYIANSIMLLCHDRPQPLLDTNMARVLERYFGPRTLSDIRYDPYLQHLARIVVDCPDSKALNWAILDFAAKVCSIRRPKCSQCDLASECRFVKEFGVKSSKAAPESQEDDAWK
jgi:A/G-specific adenine glycosylase